MSLLRRAYVMPAFERQFPEWSQGQRELEYATFAENHRFAFCWACGRDRSHQPSDWYAPWMVERAHIIPGRRVEDPRAVILLCSLCHRISHAYKGGRFFVEGEPYTITPLDLSHRLWLKRRFDPGNYSRPFLETLAIKRLPTIHKPPLAYFKQLESRRGEIRF